MTAVAVETAQASFGAYRERYDALRNVSVEVEGIWYAPWYERAIADERSVGIHDEKSNSPLLLLTPTSNLAAWYNEGFYHNLAPECADVPVFQYSHLAREWRQRPDDYLAAMGPAVLSLARQRGVLAYDTSGVRAGRTQREVMSMLHSIGVTVHDLTPTPPLHYHYASTADLTHPRSDEELQKLDLPAVYAAATESRHIKADDNQSVVASLSPGDIDRVCEFYEREHDKLSQTDPVYAGFVEDDLVDILRSPEATKVVYRTVEDGRIINVTMVMNGRQCGWFNQAFLRRRYPEQYRKDRIIVGVGSVTDMQALRTCPETVRALRNYAAEAGLRNYSPATRGLHAVAETVAVAGGKAVFAFACDEASNSRKVPAITQQAMEESGLNVHYELVGHQVFKALQLSLS